jgi:Fe-S oxidoreductase
VHGHCHHKSVLHFDTELDLLRRAGVELDVPDQGCCGMAGAFGFEAGDHYEVSLAVGERALLPAVRASDSSTPIVTGGFSCREQVRQQTGREAVHPAELLAGALHRADETAR